MRRTKRLCYSLLPTTCGELSAFVTPYLTNPNELKVLQGPGDEGDTEDPLTLNFVFPNGHLEYIDFFCGVAEGRIS